MGTHFINILNAEEDERQRRERERIMEFREIDPKGGKGKHIVNAPVHCVQCGEEVKKLIFCSAECEANYKNEVDNWLDGIEDLLPSARAKKS